MCRTRQNTRKYIIGFQSTLLFSALQNGGIVGNPSRQFIQILHTANNHWLTVSNLFCRTNEVCLYDSLSTDLDNKDKPAQASWRPIFLVMYPDVQQQTNFSNCGLFTIACAFALCCNIRPESCMFCEGAIPDWGNYLCRTAHNTEVMVEGSLCHGWCHPNRVQIPV